MTAANGTGRKPLRGSAIAAIVCGAIAVGGAVGIGLMLLFVRALSDPAPTAGATLSAVVGVRADGDRLKISTGSSCPAGTTFELHFGDQMSNREVVRESLDEPGNTITVRDPAQDGANRKDSTSVDWHDFTRLDVVVHLPGDPGIWTSTVNLTRVEAESATHSPDEFLFGERVGWETAQEVIARDRKDLVTVCTSK